MRILFAIILALPFTWATFTCPKGHYIVTTTSPIGRIIQSCQLCPSGTFGSSVTNNTPSCSGKCAAGFFGSRPGAADSTCDGPCPAGYFCPEGTTDFRSFPCGGNGFYCPVGSVAPVAVPTGYTAMDGTILTRQSIAKCEPGFYCDGNGASKPCPSGSFGHIYGLSSSTCSGTCPIGYYCPAQTTNPIPCPAGRYGDTTGLSSEDCSGECSPGYYCLPASTSATPAECEGGRNGNQSGLPSEACSKHCYLGGSSSEMHCTPSVCPSGYYCPQGSDAPVLCGDVSRFCPAGSSNFTVVSSGHYTGRWLDDASTENGALSQDYEAVCEPGTYCVGGEKFDCPAGTYGIESGLTTPDCSGPCPAGFVCPIATVQSMGTRCGGVDKFCPQGSSQSQNVSTGYYTVQGTLTTRSAEVPCEEGFYCEGGLRFPCPAGSYGDVTGLSTSSCSGLCAPGYYCPVGSTSATQNPCSDTGSTEVFCPLGSGSPQVVAHGYFASEELEGGLYASQSVCTDMDRFVTSGVCVP